MSDRKDSPATWSSDTTIQQYVACLELAFLLTRRPFSPRCIAFLYSKYVKKDDQGKVKGRKHWSLTSQDLADKLGVRISDESLKSAASKVREWVARDDWQGLDMSKAFETIKSTYPSLFEVFFVHAPLLSGVCLFVPSVTASPAYTLGPIRCDEFAYIFGRGRH